MHVSPPPIPFTLRFTSLLLPLLPQRRQLHRRSLLLLPLDPLLKIILCNHEEVLNRSFMERLDTKHLIPVLPDNILPSMEERKLHSLATDDGGGDQNSDNKNRIVEKYGEGLVALNIAELVVVATDQYLDPTVMKNSLSRKGSQRSGGGGGGVAVSPVGESSSSPWPKLIREKPRTGWPSEYWNQQPLLEHVAVEEEECSAGGLPRPPSAGGRRRRATGGRRPSPWPEPRTVLFVFASLSCMGTLILLYFTISMSRMNNPR